MSLGWEETLAHVHHFSLTLPRQYRHDKPVSNQLREPTNNKRFLELMAFSNQFCCYKEITMNYDDAK